jgi:hypothetical protein
MRIGLFSQHPVIKNDIENFDEMIEIIGFLEVGIRAKAISFGDILIESGTAQHDGAKPREFRLVPQPVQDFEARHSWHLEIEDQQIWKREFVSIRKLAFAFEVLDDLHAIGDFMHLNGFPVPAQGKLEQTAIVGIVFGQEDCKFIIHIPPKDK